MIVIGLNRRMGSPCHPLMTPKYQKYLKKSKAAPLALIMKRVVLQAVQLKCLNEMHLGHCQLIPGMADFSQGFWVQSVGRVKKKKKKRPWLQIYPKIILEMYHKTLLLGF